MAKLLVFQRKDCTWAWHLEADNGDIIATDGSQGYENEKDCQAMADKIVINGGYKAADRKRRSRKECE